MEDKKNILTELEIFKNIDSSKSDEALDRYIAEYEEFAFNIAWNKLYNERWITESDVIFGVLEYFISIKNEKKCNYIAWMLNKYYPNFLTEKLNESITNEEYEKCGTFDKLSKISEMPQYLNF